MITLLYQISQLKIKDNSTILICSRSTDVMKFINVLLPLISDKNCIIKLIARGSIQSFNIMQQLISPLNLDIEFNTINQLLNGELDSMIPDFIIGNPPFESKKGENKTQQLWATLTVKFFSILKPGGTQALIHPGGHRFAVDGSMDAISQVAKIYKDYETTFMQFNDKKTGKKTFDATTDYDVIVVNKMKARKGCKTPISTKNEDLKLNIQNEYFIPTNNISTFLRLKAQPGEDKLCILYSSSAYETRQPYMSKVKTIEFKYPCVYGYPDGEFTFFYSNTNTKVKDFFGIPKLIFKRGVVDQLLDLEGKYGLTQFAIAIVDTPTNLLKIAKVTQLRDLNNERNSMVGVSENSFLDGQGHVKKALDLFRKNWWETYYTEEMNNELIEEGRLDKDEKFIR